MRAGKALAMVGRMVASRSISLSDWDSNFVFEVGSDLLGQVTVNTYIILFGLT